MGGRPKGRPRQDLNDPQPGAVVRNIGECGDLPLERPAPAAWNRDAAARAGAAVRQAVVLNQVSVPRDQPLTARVAGRVLETANASREVSRIDEVTPRVASDVRGAL